ncbi:MAG: membrane protein insertase YidC, partial [Alphaproteobacteria bacterium HGW-Alphaproteobacteria-8]
MSDQKNMIMAAALSFLVIVLWQYFLAPPPPDPAVIAAQQQTQQLQQEGVEGVPAGPLPTGSVTVPLEQALAASPRVQIVTPRLTGSISLRGGRVDELRLLAHRETVDPASPPVEQLFPYGTENPYYALWGWTPARGAQTGPTPGADTPWTQEGGDALAPGRPVTLVWDNGAGLVFRRAFSIDDNYMFTITQSVQNNTGQAVTLAPYGTVARHGTPPTIGFYILHEGAIGHFDGTLKEIKYSDMLDFAADPVEGGPAERVGVNANGWLGFTDKYWMTTLIGGPD